MAYDVLIKNGTLVDGTGTSARHGNVAINAERIVGVGQVNGQARRR
ncbi:MAG: hypothetical protein QF435_12120 [Arenicellales bacterium]|jgi:N-acyl-D-aspartate/D-glutamate deacylase|nr:hypothetical protein [Arenicellales bacterium]|tara:strand:- start:117 stop:254 length:138 start_codon:yes stop_codon:yes gene_type:complete